MKLKWNVGAVPVGRFRSFEKRGFPSADYPDGSPAASIHCADDYNPILVREGKHSPLTVRVADFSVDTKTHGRFVWRKLKKQAATLDEAKAMALAIIESHPEIHPKVNYPRMNSWACA